MEGADRAHDDRAAAPEPGAAEAPAAAPGLTSLLRGSLREAVAAGARPRDARHLSALQSSAGNAAVARLLREVAPPETAGAQRPAAADGADPARRAERPDATGGAQLLREVAATGAGLLVDDDAQPTGAQLRRGEFLDRVQVAVCAVAERELAGIYRTAGCPWIEHWVAHYRQRPAAEVEAAVLRYAPAAAAAAAAADWVEHVSARVEAGIRAWRETGEVPDVPAESPGVPPGEPAPSAGVARSPLPTPLGLDAGEPLDASVRVRMEPLLGASLARVRVHPSEPVVRREGAHALAIGRHVAFAPGRYEPGTPIGDALIAHELAHVVQQTAAGGPGVEPLGAPATGGSGATPLAGLGGEPGAAPLAGALAALDAGADGALERDATRSAALATASLWSAAPAVARLARERARPALRSKLALQRCGEDESLDQRIWVPTSTRPADGGAGTPPTVSNGGGRTQVRFDGDGDQMRELTADIGTTGSWPDGAARGVHLDLTQVSSGQTRGADFELPDIADGGGPARVGVVDVTDGRQPTEIGLVAPPAEQSLLIHAPRRGAADLTHDVELGGESVLTSGNQLRSLTFPPETAAPHAVFSTEDPNRAPDAPPAPTAPRNVGGIWTHDVTVGSYGDRFRITFRKPDPAAPATALGVSVLSGGQPVSGYQADLTVAGDLSVRTVQADAAALAFDLDGDGQTDVTLHDRLTEAPSGGPMDRDRDHRIAVSGPAVRGERTFSFPVRDGEIAAGLRPGEAAFEQAASQARAVTGLDAQAGLTGVDAELEQIDQFLITMRQVARDEHLISAELFSAWEQVSFDFMLIGAGASTLTEAQRREIARHASAFHSLLVHETEAGVRWEGSAGVDGPGEEGDNPYTGGRVIRGGGFVIHEAPLVWVMAINDGDWPRATREYSRFLRGMDRWIAQRNRETHGSMVDPRRPETARASAIEQLTGMRGNLAGIQGRGRTRVSAVLHVAEEYERTGRISEVPLSMYYWRDGSDWALQDFSRVDETPVWRTPAAEGQSEPPRELFLHLDDNDHFPRGTVHYRLPSGGGGQVPTTGPSTLRQVLTYGAMIAAGVGLAAVTRGGSLAVVGGYILAGSSLVGAGMAAYDLIDRYRHDNLTASSVVLDLTDIVAAATGLGALRAGRILTGVRVAAAAGQAQPMRWGIRWADRWFLPLTQANRATDMVTLAVMASHLEAQFTQLQRMPEGEDKNRALRSFFLQAALTGGIGALQIRGLIPEIHPGRNLRVELVNGVEYAVPEGASVQGRAINQSRAGLDSGPADEAGSRRARHVEGIRTAIGGAGGEALAEIEELALAGARGDVTAGPDGALQRGGRASGTLDELVQKLLRANSESAAHGVDRQYSLRLGAPGADGRRPVEITSEPRGSADPAQVMTQYLAGTTGRRGEIGGMVETLRGVDAGSHVDVLPDGRLRINNQIEIEAARLADMRRADADNLRKLLVGTRLLDAAGGTLEALRATGAPGTEAAGWLEGFARSGSFRLRLFYHRALGDQLGRTGFGLAGAEQAAMEALMNAASPAERSRMFDLYNEGTRGADPSWRTIYAQSALAQNPANLREFVNHYQFAKADIDRRFLELERLAADRLARATGAGERLPRARGGTRAFNLDDARAEVRNAEATRLGLPAPASFDELVRAEFRSPAGRTASQGREAAALAEAGSRAGAAVLAPGTGAVDDPANLVERLRATGRVPFGEATTGAYHVHKHHRELPPSERFDPAGPRPGVEGEHDAVLESARRTIATGDAGSIRSEALQEGLGRRFYFERTVSEGGATYRLRAIVIVNYDGTARLITYGSF